MSCILIPADVMESVLDSVLENCEAGFVLDEPIPEELVPALGFILWNQLDEWEDEENEDETE